jgi:hypothetical protein
MGICNYEEERHWSAALPAKSRTMRAEAQAMVNEIEESLVLLRRRL